MKIVVIHQDLFMQGGQLVAAKLANGLSRRGHEVHVVVSKVHADLVATNTVLKPFPLDEGVGFHVLPNRKASRNVFALAALLRRLRPDVVVPNVPTYNQCAVLARIVGLLKIPIVYVEHCLMGPTSSRLARFFLGCDDRIVCVSDGVADFVRQSLGEDSDRILRVYNPSLSGRPIDREGDIHPCMRGSREYTFVSIGEMHTTRKGFDVLIRAFAVVHKAEPKTRLVLFGRGDRSDELRRLAESLGLSEAVVFPGFTSNPVGNMTYADAFVFASRRETFGLVLVEALSAGLPVISTDCQVGPAEILKHGRIGQLVPVDDEQEMAAAMLRLMRGQFVPSESFDDYEFLESTAVDHYETILRDVIGARK